MQNISESTLNTPDSSHQHLALPDFSGAGTGGCGNLQYQTVSLQDKPVRQHSFFISIQQGTASGLRHALGHCGRVL